MSVIDLLKAVVLGMTEGFAEWLPVSADAHLFCMRALIGAGGSSDYQELLLASMKLGAGAAALFMFWPKIDIGSRKRRRRAAAFRMWGRLLAGTVPYGILSFFSSAWIRERFSGGYVMAGTLCCYGVIFFLAEQRIRYRHSPVGKAREITPQLALYIGMFQVLSLIPGTSRTAAALLGGLFLGCTRSCAAEFSLLLGIPAVLCRAVLLFVRTPGGLSGVGAMGVFSLAAGFLAAFVVSLNSIRYFLLWCRKKTLRPFGYYRIALGAAVMIWTFLTRLVS